MSHLEGHGEWGSGIWPETNLVLRERKIKLKHVKPDEIAGYQCQYPDPENPGQFKTVGANMERKQFDMVEDAEGNHNGSIMVLVEPGASPGPVSCLAYAYDPPEMAHDLNAYRAWKAENPDNKLVTLKSDWSNTQPFGDVQPDPVPEVGFTVGLQVAVIFFVILAKVFHRPTVTDRVGGK